MITDRQGKLLHILIGQYINKPEPVSSKAIVKSGPFSVSSATIRYEMNVLEKAGYLTHLHTSGGRVPTSLAYRFFVDNLLARPNIYVPEATKKKIHQAIDNADNDPQELNKIIANLVSALSDNMVVTNIQNSDYFYKTGLSSLFALPEFREFNRVFNAASIFDHFERMFNEMEKEFFGIAKDDIQVFIGEENPMKTMKDETVILAKYPLPGRNTGSMTIIGPTRMNYEKNIGLIKCVVNEIKNKIKKI